MISGGCPFVIPNHPTMEIGERSPASSKNHFPSPQVPATAIFGECDFFVSRVPDSGFEAASDVLAGAYGIYVVIILRFHGRPFLPSR